MVRKKELIKRLDNLKEEHDKLIKYLDLEKEKFISKRFVCIFNGEHIVGEDYIDWKYKKKTNKK